MKRSVFVLLTSSIVLTSLGTTSRAWGYSGGDGSEGSPFEIATADDMISMHSDIENYDKHFVMTADIDLTGWSSGTLSLIAAGYTPFSGQFDGAGHVVRNLLFTGWWDSHKLALFGLTSSEARIMNLGVEDVSITGDDYLGALVAYNSGTITNCYSTGRISTDVSGSIVTSNAIGGLVAKNDGGTIIDCHSSVHLVGKDQWRSGGLVGLHYNGGRIISCYSTGTIETVDPDSGTTELGGTYIGGLVGSSKYSSIESSYSTSTIRGMWAKSGGLVGETLEDTITECSFRGTIESTDGSTIGGLVGENKESTIDSCYSTGTVSSADDIVAGLVAENRGTITNCYSACDVYAGGQFAGGLVGSSSFGAITSSNCSGSVTAEEEYVGGLIGVNYDNTITDCFSTGEVNGSDYVGGLVGYLYSGSVTTSFWDTEESGIDTSDGGTGKTTAEMQSLHSCLGSGWDFRVVGELNVDTRFYNIGSMTIREAGTFTNNDELYNESGSTLLNNGNLLNAGALINQSGATLTSNYVFMSSYGSTISNHGVITNSGTFFSAGDLINQSDGEIENTGSLSLLDYSSATNAGTLNNSGSIEIYCAAEFTNTGVLTNDGDIVCEGNVTNEANATFTNNGVFESAEETWFSNDGLFDNTEGAVLTINGTFDNEDGTFSNQGRLQGEGTFIGNLAIDAGTLAPGNSPGTMNIIGDFTLADDGSLEMELAGLIRGRQYDALVVAGTVTLGGTLDVTLIDGFVPDAGDVFDVLDWDTLALGSDFDTVNLPTLDGGLYWDTSALYTTGQLGVVPEPGMLVLLLIGALTLLARRCR